MLENIPLNKHLSARKRPSQARSKKTVSRILNATRRLLGQRGVSRLSNLTTNHIAKEAGISVGSLYQYFPNKEAIIFGLYREMLDQIQAVINEFKSEDKLSLPRNEFFDTFNRAMKAAEADIEVVFEMHNAMKVYPALVKADRQHADLIAREVAGFMKHYGSKWPLKKLERLALYVYYINFGSWLYRDHVRPPEREVFAWEVSALDFMIAQCFD